MNSIMCCTVLITIYSVFLYECCKPRARPPPRTVHEILGDDGNDDSEEEDVTEEEEKDVTEEEEKDVTEEEDEEEDENHDKSD